MVLMSKKQENVLAIEIVKKTNGLGIAALVIGIISIAGSWVPIVNIISIVMAVVGILIGIWSLINVLTKKAKGLAMPIISIILGIISISMAVSMNNHVSDSLSNDTKSSAKTDASGSASTAKVEEASSDTMETKGTLNNCEIEILSVRMAQKGAVTKNDTAIVKYKFTNNSEKNREFNTTVSTKVFQNGVECETAYFSSIDNKDILDNGGKDLKPGSSIEVEKCYELSDKSPINVEVIEWISLNNKKIIRTFEF
jgi:hypothetical protein